MVQVNNICCLGYEDIYGNKYDMMDGVDPVSYTHLDVYKRQLVREVRFYNGEDRTLDFILTNVYVRIQGTSSVDVYKRQGHPDAV